MRLYVEEYLSWEEGDELTSRGSGNSTNFLSHAVMHSESLIGQVAGMGMFES